MVSCITYFIFKNPYKIFLNHEKNLRLVTYTKKSLYLAYIYFKNITITIFMYKLCLKLRKNRTAIIFNN